MRAIRATWLAGGLLLAGSVLEAQGLSGPRDPLVGLLLQARFQGHGVLVVLEDGKGAWRTHLDQAFQSEVLGDVPLSPQFLRPESEAARALRARFQWAEGPRWALLDPEGRLLQQGAALPTPETLAEALQRAGVPRPVAEAQAFARRHPDHHEAQRHLLEVLVKRAVRLMGPFLKTPPERPGASGTFTGSLRMSIGGPASVGSAGSELDLVRPLTPEADRRIWGAVAEQLGRVYRDSAWVGDGGRGVLPATAQHSPRMREAARRLLPAVEMRLRQVPGDAGVWAHWVTLSSVAGSRSLRTLLASLEPLPGTREFPPDSALEVYVAECRAAAAWGELRETLEARWRAGDGVGRSLVLGAGLGRVPLADLLDKSRWDRLAGPLVEACLRLGDPAAADRVVQEALQRWGSRNLPTWASQVALKAGDAERARAWAGLKVDK